MKLRSVAALLLCASLAFLTACGTEAPSSEGSADKGKLTVLASMFPEYDFARQIVGDRAEVDLLMPPGADAHSFEPGPGDMKAIQGADLLLYMNPVMDHWISELPDRIDTDGVSFVDVSKKVPKLAMPKADTLEALLANQPAPEATPVDEKTAAEAGKAHDHDEDAHEDEHHDGDAHEHEGHEGHHHENDPYDPHTWTGIRNDIIIAETIRDALIEKDPDGKDLYTKNCKTLTDKLTALDKEYAALGEKAANRPLIVADEFPFLYLAHDYKLTFVPVLSSYGEHGEASSRRLAQISDLMRDQKISVLYYTEQTEPKLGSQLAKDTGAETLMLNAGHTVSAEDMKKGLSYTDILENNLAALKKGLAVTD